MQTYIHAHSEGIATLGEPEALACGSAFDGKRVVVGLRQVLSPDIDSYSSEICCKVGAQHSVELLVYSVGLIPVGLALTVEVGSQRETSQAVSTEIEAIVGPKQPRYAVG